MGLPVTVELHGGAYRLTVDIPPRRNGEPNNGAMGRAMSLLATVAPSAFDPEPKPEPVVVSHQVATAAMRDGARWIGGSGQRYVSRLDAVTNGEQVITPADDDEGEAIPSYRCANGACAGD